MDLFVCECCGCVDAVELAAPEPGVSWLCTGCKPNSVWHGRFKQQPYDPERDNVVNRPSGVGLS